MTENKVFTDPYEAFWFLYMYDCTDEEKDEGYGDTGFIDVLDIHYAKVSPETHSVETDPSLNTLTEVWLESGPGKTRDGVYYHDWQLDCGAPTFDEALVKLANKVTEHYGPGKSRDDRPEAQISVNLERSFRILRSRD